MDDKAQIVRYRFNFRPPHTIDRDPSFTEVIKGLERSDIGVFAVATILPAMMGYRVQRTGRGVSIFAEFQHRQL